MQNFTAAICESSVSIRHSTAKLSLRAERCAEKIIPHGKRNASWILDFRIKLARGIKHACLNPRWLAIIQIQASRGAYRKVYRIQRDPHSTIFKQMEVCP